MFGSLFGTKAKPTPSTTLGYTVASADGIHSDFERIRGSIQTTNKKYREELSKYKEIAKFNEQITKGYIKNLDAMIDVSKILNYYVEIFNLLKMELEKNEKVLGETSLKVEDINYLERLTRNKVDELSGKFMKETDDLKKLYSAYGKTTELGKVNEAQESFRVASSSATETMEKIRNIQLNGLPASGGAKRRARATQGRGRKNHLRK